MSTPPLKVLMICAHEPNLDPRIRWEAEFAACRFDVTVLGFNRDDSPLPATEVVCGYRVIRLPRSSLGGFHYLWRLKNILPVGVSVVLGLLLLLGLPLIIPVALAGRLVRAAIRARYGVRSASRPAVVTLLIKLRSRLIGRLDALATVLRTQFAPATSLFWNYLRDMPEKPDVVHCNDLDTLLVGVLAKEHYGCRVVFDAHEFYPHSDPDGRWLDITFFSLLERFLIRRADAAVTVNPPLAEAMREAYGLERVHAVPNAEPWVENRPPPPPGSEMERLAAGRVKFLFQGRFTAGRGIEELIEGWAKVDGTRAALFLRGPDNVWRQGAMRLVARLGLEGSVYFLDAVGEAELVTAAAEANVGVIPYKPRIINDRLSCPNKLSQYLHAGLLVIANDLPYVKSVLSEADAGLFYSSAEPGTLANAVHRAVAEPELLKRSRQNALRFARERFNWQAQSETLYALYQPSDRAAQTARLAAATPLP
jgi:glycosyltransferase involved in cell wall biosynthesis